MRDGTVVLWIQAVLLAMQAVVMAIGAGLVYWQLKKHSEEISSTHDWNRRLASQHAAYEFMQPTIHGYWIKVQKSVIEEKKPYNELEPHEQHAVRQMLNFFESLGIALKYNIVDYGIIYDYFGYVWPLFRDCARVYIEEDCQREDPTLYENIVEYAERFRQTTAEHTSSNGTWRPLPPKGPICA